MDNLPKDLAEKLPTFEQFSKNKSGVVGYSFMIIFFAYFFYTEFLKRDDCGQKIESFERVIIQKDEMINQLNNRVTKLETALDVKTGVVEKVREELTSNDIKVGGLQ